MKVEYNENSVIITYLQGDLGSFIENITNEYGSFFQFNAIIDISKNNTITLQTLKLFTDLSTKHKKSKKSFVLVVSGIDFNKVPAKITVVPSLQEAHDIIEIEEIERDLGF